MHTTRLLAAVAAATTLSLVAFRRSGQILPFSGAGTVIAAPALPISRIPRCLRYLVQQRLLLDGDPD